MTPRRSSADALAHLAAVLGNAHDLAARGRAAYDADPALQAAAERYIERAGVILIELDRLTPELRQRHSYVEWRSAVGMRQVLAHDYDLLNPEVVWDVLAGEGFASLRRMLDTERRVES